MTVNSQSGPPKSPRPPDDLISTATSALRRFHFKTARNVTKNSSKQTQPVPKVMVMGSSTASETTINTSTESSNTIVTTATATTTDGDATEDSLDIPELDIFAVADPTPASPKTPATAKRVDTRFTFEERMPTEEALRLEARRRNSYKQAAQNLDVVEVMAEEAVEGGTRGHGGSFRRKLEVERQRAEKTSPKRRAERPANSSPEECDSPKPKHRHKKTSRRTRSPGKSGQMPPPAVDKFNYDDRHLAKYRPNTPHHAHSPHHSSSRMTPPLPDLRVDFIAETLEGRRHQHVAASSDGGVGTLGVKASVEKRGSVCLNKCLREVGAHLETSCTSPINVTTNPLVIEPAAGRRPPQATIVVQQASLSVDHAHVATVLLKSGAEFVSNVHQQQQQQESGSCKKNKLKEENMRQLLDVANNLTLEEIHDFEMRYGSPHHNRSQSVKTPGRSSGRPNYLCLPQQRSRVASMPNTGVEEEYYRLRHFSITGKGIINRGDSLKSRRSRSNNSVASSNSSTEQLPAAVSVSGAGSARTSASCSLASSRESSTSAPGPTPFKVLMLGGPAVGKSSLVMQFMTSEYLHAYDTSIDDDSGEKSVSVLLAGEESELCFIDFATADLSPNSLIHKYADPHAYCVVYSSADRSSLETAENILQNLWTLDTISTKAVILVANKADLVRSRVVTTEEGKLMATSYDCKYIETSVGINHNVDELLVGVLTQIRLKLENPERSRDLFRKRSTSKRHPNRNKSPANEAATPAGSRTNSPKKYRGSRTSASLKVRSLLGKVWARDSKSKSCENLHVL